MDNVQTNKRKPRRAVATTKTQPRVVQKGVVKGAKADQTSHFCIQSLISYCNPSISLACCCQSCSLGANALMIVGRVKLGGLFLRISAELRCCQAWSGTAGRVCSSGTAVLAEDSLDRMDSPRSFRKGCSLSGGELRNCVSMSDHIRRGIYI
ncbi:hypothetical protein CaCOL14_003206 [Colletotrichum acutatum]